MCLSREYIRLELIFHSKHLNMKTLNKIYFSLFLLASLTSCSSYLDTYPHTSASPDGVSASDLTAMRNGMYNQSRTAWENILISLLTFLEVISSIPRQLNR